MKASYTPIFVATIALVALSGAPARAADDGQKSMISGIAETVGITKHEDPQIDYRERARIVLPPKRELPPPGKSVAKGQWPVDVEKVWEQNRKKMDESGPTAADAASRSWTLIKPGDDVKVTSSGFDGAHGPACRVPDPKTGECPKAPKPEMNWNPLTWVGLEKKPATVLGAEPERESLTDPPKGYREPAEGAGVKVQN